MPRTCSEGTAASAVVTVKSAAPVGLGAELVTITARKTKGPPGISLQGLPEVTTKEARARVLASVERTCSLTLQEAVAVTVAAPRELADCSGLELPLAVAVVGALGHIQQSWLERYIIAGPLTFDGHTTRLRSALAVAEAASAAGFEAVIVPATSAAEAALAPELTVVTVTNLGDTLDHLRGTCPAEVFARTSVVAPAPPSTTFDLADLAVPEQVKQGLVLAVAGGHHVLLVGTAGSGKTMLARRLPGLLPDLPLEQALEVTRVYSLLNLTEETDPRPFSTPVSPLITRPPFRAPHYTVSEAGLLGGGRLARPGEVSMAHHGVLLLDELAEFQKGALVDLATAVGRGYVELARRGEWLRFPAKTLMVGAMAACPCGRQPNLSCGCSPERMQAHFARTEAIRALFDVTLHVAPAPVLSGPGPHGRPTSQYRRRVAKARERQGRRFCGLPLLNADMTEELLNEHCRLTPIARREVEALKRNPQLGAAVIQRLLRLARTHADLEGKPVTTLDNLEAAMPYVSTHTLRPLSSAV